MSNVRHNITNKTARRAKGTSDYLEDLEKHPGITIGKAKYYGLTPGASFLRTLNHIRTVYWAMHQMHPGPKARNLTEWVIVRQPHNAALDDDKQDELDRTFIAAMGPGIIAKFVTHTPTREKKKGKGIPGAEQNGLASAFKRIGPFIIRLRSSSRNLRRELMRAMDQLTRQWNHGVPEKDQIREMPKVREEKNKKDHRPIHEILVDIEEHEWELQHGAPKDASAFDRPALKVTRDAESAEAALRTRGFDITPAASDRDEEDLSARKNSENNIPKAKAGYWRITNPSWEAKREMHSKRKKPSKTQPACLLDSVRILCEARQLFRERLKERKKQWLLEQEAHQQLEAKQKVVPAPQQRAPAAKPREPLVPLELVLAAEKNWLPPFKTPEEASRLFACINYPVRRNQPDHQFLELGAYVRFRVPRNELLIAMQLARLRGLLRDDSRSTSPDFYCSQSQSFDYTPAQSTCPPLDPFDPVWQEAHNRLKEPMYREDWHDAADAVAIEVTKLGDLNPTQRAARFYKYLIEKKGYPPRIALLFTSVHFRSSAAPFTAFIAGLQTNIQTLGLRAAETPAAVQADNAALRVAALTSLSTPVQLPPTPVVNLDCSKHQQPPLYSKIAKHAPPSPVNHEQKRMAPQQKPSPLTPRPPERSTQPPAPSPSVKQPPAPAPEPPLFIKPESPTVVEPFIPLYSILSSVTKMDVPPERDESVAEFLERANYSIRGEVGPEGTVTISSDYFQTEINYSSLKLALWCSVLNTALPGGCRASGPDRIKFDHQIEPVVSTETCDELLQMLDEHWAEISEASRQPKIKELWRQAYHSSISEHGVLRAVNIFTQLTGAGVNANIATALVLTQFRGRFGYVAKFLDRVNPVRRILRQVTNKTPTPSTVEALQAYAKQAGVTINATSEEAPDDLTLLYKGHAVPIKQSELAIYIGLGAIAAGLPTRATGGEAVASLEFGPVGDINEYRRGIVADEWLQRLSNQGDNLRRAMADPEMRHSWIQALESTKDKGPYDRIVTVVGKMIQRGLTADEALLLTASQAGPNLAKINLVVEMTQARGR